MKLGEVVGDKVGEVLPDLPVKFVDAVSRFFRGHCLGRFDEMSIFRGVVFTSGLFGK